MPSEPYHTIPVRRSTWDRFKGYRMGGASYDEVLNDIMDMIPLEVYAQRYVANRRSDQNQPK